MMQYALQSLGATTQREVVQISNAKVRLHGVSHRLIVHLRCDWERTKFQRNSRWLGLINKILNKFRYDSKGGLKYCLYAHVINQIHQNMKFNKK